MNDYYFCSNPGCVNHAKVWDIINDKPICLECMKKELLDGSESDAFEPLDFENIENENVQREKAIKNKLLLLD